MKLIFCLAANRVYPALARVAGWHIGARLPATLYDDHQPLAFADQDWRKFDGLRPDDPRYVRAFGRYIAALRRARPAMVSVLDWTPDRSRDEIFAWVRAAAEHTSESMMIIPKTPGTIVTIPPDIGGRRVVLGFSVPTRHGATEVDPQEFTGWPIHLLGGNPNQQIAYASLLASYGCEIVSADGNLVHNAAGKGTFWEYGRSRNLGRHVLTTIEALRRSLVEVPRLWRSVGWTIESED